MLIYELFLAWRTLSRQMLTSCILIMIIAFSLALPLAVLVLGDGARQSIIRASDPFGVLVIGAKGSAQQLVLSTLLLQGLPVGNINAAIYDTLLSDARASLVVPLAMGDSVGGARILGTSDALLELRPSTAAEPSFRISEGRFFEADFEAVLGSRAAAGLGLGVGDRFFAEHGVERGLQTDQHEQPHTVVGILTPSGTPYDSAVFVTVSSVWRAHERDEDDPMNLFSAGGAALDRQLTALLVRPVSFVDANRLWQEFATGSVAQAAFPGQEIGGLFALFSIGENVLTAVAYLVLLMAGIVIFLSIYNAIQMREQSLAVLRTVGGRRVAIFRMVIFETLLITLAGALLSRFIGYAVAFGISRLLTEQTGIMIGIRFLGSIEPSLWAVTLGIASLSSLVPAVRAYRIDAAQKLFVA